MRRGKFQQLIPRERSRRIIRLEKRGRGQRKRFPGAVVFCVLGISCLAYCAGIAIMGFGTWFFLIWGCLGLMCLALAAILRSERLMENAEVVIVTNNFHVFRALGIARKQGYANVEGLAASSVLGMGPNNLLREFLGVVKDFLVGNL